jgi:cell division protein FtsL
MNTFGAAIAIGLVLALGYVWERADLVSVGYRIEQLKHQRTKLLRDRDELRLKVSALTSPERLARAAAEKLAMGPPAQGQVVMVKLDREARPAGGRGREEIRLAKNDTPPPAAKGD